MVFEALRISIQVVLAAELDHDLSQRLHRVNGDAIQHAEMTAVQGDRCMY